MNAWLRAIDTAATEAEILTHTRDFLSLVHPRDLALLPEECRDLRIETDGDIGRVRDRLSRGCKVLRANADDDGTRVREMLSYLSRASERLGELRSRV